MSMTFLPARLTPQFVDGAIPSRGDDPASWVGRQTRLRPFLGRHQEGVLNRLLGEVDVAKEADQGGYRLAGLFPEGPIDYN